LRGLALLVFKRAFIFTGFLFGEIAYPNRNPEYICGSSIDNFFKPYLFNRGSNFSLLLSVFSLTPNLVGGHYPRAVLDSSNGCGNRESSAK